MGRVLRRTPHGIKTLQFDIEVECILCFAVLAVIIKQMLLEFTTCSVFVSQGL